MENSNVSLKKKLIWFLILFCILIAISLPRFNRNDFGIYSLTAGGKGSLGDAADYVNITLYFRGEKTAADLRPPYTYRPLIPYIAAKCLPVKAMTAINLINIVAFMVATFFIYKIIVWLNISFTLCMIGCLLFIVSFPTFYYVSIGYIDPVVVCLLTVGLYFIFTKDWLLLAAIIIIGSFVKETIIILNLALAAYLFFSHKLFTKKGLILNFILLLAYAVSSCFAREIIPVNSMYVWMPSLDRLIHNVSRLRCWLSFILTYGVPGIIALFIFRYKTTVLFQKRFVETATLIAGIFISILLFGYSILTAEADGRFIWTSYPFSVPLAVIVLNESKNSWLIKFTKHRRYRVDQRSLEYTIRA